ncbi:DNA polymerase III subunit beta [candidate division WWE3 bacterium CG09_land_8_20_14_0_10_39_24]|uniref:Beta sliding clamp n=2 Tax=Katanobacteria TaxID=422282 RepID=A0A2G9XBV1_UNCKA|nr:MAG: DNA polymerase III subunit beta [bacterium CG2_30_40_12]OJI09230.1 MAG: DNA polymerase III subunit beta [bacterium CG09_39_24]PIP04436.1 MAG: DNA polymerase III subunit beta [candidate division WWE3 bacterium CG23_combo_of_CG06-09_8_20_14_all_40_14]PIS13010.1 MAG: DNA polymerase III subunit beta [candidate division WWE3 bacterium CG09_land_8_20_14_0_10_39_24]PJE52068.1 MAG: DNA polymerase III subunit beta [candidate division WWE3 bacterium CG10_big_fil_rev_8_21_14_0_10_39_14]
MKFTVLQAELLKGINVVSKAVSFRGSLPILGNILLQSDSGRLKLCATDLDKSITTWVSGKMDKEGAITVPARILAEFVSNLPPGQVAGVVENTELTLSSQKASAVFNGADAEEFPLPQNLSKGDFSFTLKSKDFLVALSEVYFAAAMDESRPVLTGVYMHKKAKELTLAAVDGFRLSERILKTEKSEKSELPKDIVLPARTLLELARLAQNAGDTVNIAVLETENLAILESGDMLATTRILEGDFPDYKKIIPSGSKTAIEVSFEEFFNAVRIANVFAKDASNVVKIVIKPKEGLFVLGEALEIGRDKTFVPAKITGEEMEILFDGKFLNDFLSNVKCENLLIETEGAVNPAVFKLKERNDYLHIIMPRRP